MATATVIKEAQPQLRTVRLQVAALDRHGYLFGQKLKQSLSPMLHSVVYQELGLNWGQIRLDSADMPLFLELMQHPKFYGTSVRPAKRRPDVTSH